MYLARRHMSLLAVAAVAVAPAAVAAAHPAIHARTADKPEKAEKPEKPEKPEKGNNGNGNAGTTGNGKGNNGNGNGNGGSTVTTGAGDTSPTVTPTVTATSTPSPTPAATTQPAPANTETPQTTPVKGKSAVGQVASGTVTVTLPGATEATPLDGGSVPLGATVDATQGKVQIVTALPDGETQSATFWGGEFKLAQSKDSGRVTIRMPKVSVADECAPKTSGVIASASKAKGGKKRRLKSLWVQDNHGRFGTHGRNSVATVRGTVWVTRERCDGTFTYVRKGRVDVVDRNTGRHVRLHAGVGYLARDAR
jgi:hypothetical protein